MYFEDDKKEMREKKLEEREGLGGQKKLDNEKKVKKDELSQNMIMKRKRISRTR